MNNRVCKTNTTDKRILNLDIGFYRGNIACVYYMS